MMIEDICKVRNSGKSETYTTITSDGVSGVPVRNTCVRGSISYENAAQTADRCLSTQC